MKLKAYAVNGGNGSYIEFSNGDFLDTVVGDSYFSEVPAGGYNELIDWANENAEWSAGVVAEWFLDRWNGKELESLEGVSGLAEYVGA